MEAQQQMVRTKDWMRANKIPNSTFFKWKKKGLAPKTTNIGAASFIFIEDLKDWESRMRSGAGEG